MEFLAKLHHYGAFVAGAAGCQNNGQCTSLSPVEELVCAGDCLPVQMLANWIGSGHGRKLWGRREAQEWRCVTERTRHQRVQLRCPDGSDRTYRISVVTSCRCKRYSRQHNDSGTGADGQDGTSRLQRRAKSGPRQGEGAPKRTGTRRNPKTDTLR
ncbi:hypothetical protein AAFF_G00395260 [Aldrovandia affinis]|uniref:CTCK domain-containing protein n=1 Tax=Aldrovandia affinis TaxID=143900 RepID=A0AAD7R4H5_9TELE|nr:hypothetical protein AAFF_G00395260 [Aldrovandia affinis]